MMRKLSCRALIVVVAAGAITSAALALFEPDRSTARDAEDVSSLTDGISNVPAGAHGETSSPVTSRLTSASFEDFLRRADSITVQFSDRKVMFPIVQDVPVADIAETILEVANESPDNRIFVDAKKSLVVAVDSQQAQQVVRSLAYVLFERPEAHPEFENNPEAILHRADGKRAEYLTRPSDVQTLVGRGNSISVMLGRYNIHFELPARPDRARLAKRIVALHEKAPSSKLQFLDMRDYLVIATPVADVVRVAGAITHELAYCDPDEPDAESTEPEDDELPTGPDVNRQANPTRKVVISDAVTGVDVALDDVLQRADRITVLFNDRKVGFPAIVREVPRARIAELIQSIAWDKKLGARLTANGKELVVRVDSQQAARVVRIITLDLFEELTHPNELTNPGDTIQMPDGKRRSYSDLIVGPEGVRTLVERGNRIAVSLDVYNINFWLPERVHRTRLANRIISLNGKGPTIRFLDGRNHLWLETTTANVVRVVNAITRELAHFDPEEFENESSTANRKDSSDDVRELPSKPKAAADSPDEADAFSESVNPPANEEIELIEPTTGKPIALDEFLKRADRIYVVFSDRKVRLPIDRKVPAVRLAEAIQSLAREKKSRARLTAIGKELIMRVDRDNAAHVVHTLTHLLFEEFDVLLPSMRIDQKTVIHLPDGRRGTLAELAIEPKEVRTVVARTNRISLNLGLYNISIETPDRIHWRRLANRLLSLKEIDPAIKFIDGRDHLSVRLNSPATDVTQIVEAITRELSYFDSDEYERDIAAGGRLRPFSDPGEELSGLESATSQSGDGDPAREAAMRLLAADVSAQLQEQYLTREKEAAEIAGLIMNTSAPSERESLRRKLRRAVAKSFALRQHLHQAELAAFQARMVRTRQLIEARERIKDQIIDRRVEDLVNPRLKWEPAAAGSGSPPSASQPDRPTDLGSGIDRAGAARDKPTTDENHNDGRQPALTPQEVVAHADKLLERQSIVVRFRVGSVDTVNATMPNVESFRMYRLHPAVNPDPAAADSFCVVLEYGMEKALKKQGIKNLQAHFTDKTVEVQGQLSEMRGPNNPTESLRQYIISIADLDQLRIVSTAAARAPQFGPSDPYPNILSTTAALNPREEARQILQQVLEQGMQPMKSSWFDSEYPYSEVCAGQTRRQNARFLPDYVELLNEYLENHRADYGTRPYLSAVQSLEYVLRSWFAGDQWPLQKTAEVLAAALAEDLSAPARADGDDPLGVETQTVVLRQLARLTMQIPDAVADSIPRSQKTRDKLALLNDMLSHRANDRWVSQEHVRLAGLLEEAPFHAIRAIMQAESDKDSATVEKWLYAVSSPAAYDAHQSSPPEHVRPPLDPVLMLAILRKLTGDSERTDARIARVVADPHPRLLFPRHIDDVLSGRWAFRELAHDALLEMAAGTKCVELRTQIEKLDPRVAAARKAAGRE